MITSISKHDITKEKHCTLHIEIRLQKKKS
jgi:hypothetical protein